ncbi:hypothetical protein SAMN05444156_2371 [Verrucomicrobium sp. GAS474]|uniref:hypothetical protein n=1 Tax=Verrucomicrobium sp. GAS474 TaxID=1882831 RepID=UPI000879E54A|nr:hypothetical protein [Verrucomicrobium sp. GAS474]SDU16791.1 hypothetical protein SAMN05444156_2371 [Verrucomicrobium sp. GAS474]
MKRPGLFVLFALFALLLVSSRLLADGLSPASGSGAAAPLPPPGTLPIQDRENVLALFQDRYAKAKQPRLLIYINRDLVRDRGEMTTVTQVQNGTQVKGDAVPTPGAGATNIQIGSNQSAPGSSSATSLNPTATGAGGERQESSSVAVRVKDGADKGVLPINDYDARQVEELFTQPFFDAGARFLDQKISALLLKPFAEAGTRFLTAPETDKEKADIEALKKSADIVIEVMARKRVVVIPLPGGEERREDRIALTVTAIDLRQPGLILARISTDTLFGFNGRDGEARERKAKKIVSAEIIDQAALALMQRLQF